jgi:hypothetical protein
MESCAVRIVDAQTDHTEPTTAAAVVITARLSAKHHGVGLEWAQGAGRLQLLTVIGERIPDNKFTPANLSEEDAAVAAVIDASSTALAVPRLGPPRGCGIGIVEEAREGP